MAIEKIRIGLRLDPELHKPQVNMLKVLPYGGKNDWVMQGVEYALDRGFTIEPEVCRGIRDNELSGQDGRPEPFQVSVRIRQDLHPAAFTILSELPVGSGSPWIREALLFAASQGYEGPGRRSRRKLYRSGAIEPKEVTELKNQVHKLEGIVSALTSALESPQRTAVPNSTQWHSASDPAAVQTRPVEPAAAPTNVTTLNEPLPLDPGRAVVATIPVSEIEDVIDHDREFITERQNRRTLEEQLAQFGD